MGRRRTRRKKKHMIKKKEDEIEREELKKRTRGRRMQVNGSCVRSIFFFFLFSLSPLLFFVVTFGIKIYGASFNCDIGRG